MRPRPPLSVGGSSGAHESNWLFVVPVSSAAPRLNGAGSSRDAEELLPTQVLMVYRNFTRFRIVLKEPSALPFLGLAWQSGRDHKT